MKLGMWRINDFVDAPKLGEEGVGADGEEKKDDRDDLQPEADVALYDGEQICLLQPTQYLLYTIDDATEIPKLKII